jgi:hypothetical protein
VDTDMRTSSPPAKYCPHSSSSASLASVTIHLWHSCESSVGVTGEMTVNVDNEDDDEEQEDEDKAEYDDSRCSASRSVL